MENETQPIAWNSLVSFAGLFGMAGIRDIEIPMIQRDYAQGRSTGAVKRIRDKFIETLCRALLPGNQPVDLDFVFGDKDESGKFYPLDGQQRLTTLFLLHCYLSWQSKTDGKSQSWSRFRYETRPGAREFCIFLVEAQPDLSDLPSIWLRDQARFLPTWEFDPTIQSMLTMVDALHMKSREIGLEDFEYALGRLLDADNPAIRFHVLPVQANGLTDTLYIKMNSRGKPLTEFENLKAHIEVVLKSAAHEQADRFTLNVDTIWSDMLWDYRGDDNLIDDEFMRLFRCIAEINAWKANIEFPNDVHDDDLVTLVYAKGQPNAAASVSFLFDAFAVWEGKNIGDEFGRLFAKAGAPDGHGIPLFNAFDKEGVNLFSACCRHYGTKAWTLANTLLFYGVLVYFRDSTQDAAAKIRLRVLRNLIDASSDEIRAGERNNMPKLLAETSMLIREGNLEQIATFNQTQVANEIAKAALLKSHPGLEDDMHRLEDHDLLRGGLTFFDLEAEHFTVRAATFRTLFTKGAGGIQHPYLALTGALLAKGDYARRSVRNSEHFICDFGAQKNDEPWRELFRARKRENLVPRRGALRDLLDAIAQGNSLSAISTGYGATSPKDWRYYFIKYDEMRGGASGRYTISPGGGYSVCMLEKEIMTSDYYDPYLLAIVTRSGLTSDQIANQKWPRCFTGYESIPRELILKSNRIAIRCANEGWIVRLPEDLQDDACTAARLEGWGFVRVGEEWQRQIPQVKGIDTEDRIEIGEALLRQLVEAKV